MYLQLPCVSSIIWSCCHKSMSLHNTLVVNQNIPRILCPFYVTKTGNVLFYLCFWILWSLKGGFIRPLGVVVCSRTHPMRTDRWMGRRRVRRFLQSVWWIHRSWIHYVSEQPETLITDRHNDPTCEPSLAFYNTDVQDCLKFSVDRIESFGTKHLGIARTVILIQRAEFEPETLLALTTMPLYQ